MKKCKTTSPERRRLLSAIVAGAAASVLPVAWAEDENKPHIKVWKGPLCGCCVDWIVHLEENGFDVSYVDEGNAEARQRLGMPVKYGSCHTGEIDGYAIEGHVPAREIHRLLKEKPTGVVGLSVPAMPRGSPGMDGPKYGNVVDPYDVLLISRDGEASVFQSYR